MNTLTQIKTFLAKNHFSVGSVAVSIFCLFFFLFGEIIHFSVHKSISGALNLFDMPFCIGIHLSLMQSKWCLLFHLCNAHKQRSSKECTKTTIGWKNKTIFRVWFGCVVCIACNFSLSLSCLYLIWFTKALLVCKRTQQKRSKTRLVDKLYRKTIETWKSNFHIFQQLVSDSAELIYNYVNSGSL